MEIPEKYQEFCKEVAKLAINYELNNFDIKFQPGFSDLEIWNNDINCNWSQGRHGDSNRKLFITSTIMVHTQLEE